MNSLAAPHAPHLLAALHTRIEQPFATALDDWIDRAALAGHLAGRQLAAAVATQGHAPEACFVSSTLLSASLTSRTVAVHRFTRAFEAASGLRLHGIVSAYMCAGWGFVLRHALRHTAIRRIAVCLVDLDLHDLSWHHEHPVIGRSGFGLSALLFDLPEARTALPECGGPHANSAFAELLMALRSHRQRHGLAPTFLPFTQPALHGMAERVLGAKTLTANRYATWGHCFGSDPWIGLIEWLAEAHTPPGRVLVGAIGFNGYFTVSAIDVSAGTPTRFDVLDGETLCLTDLAMPSQPPSRGAAQTTREILGAVTS